MDLVGKPGLARDRLCFRPPAEWPQGFRHRPSGDRHRSRAHGRLGDAQDRDETIGGFYDTTRGGLRVVSLDPAYPVSSDDERITIVATSAVIDDGRTLALPGDTIDGLTEATNYALFWNLDVSAYEVEAYPATTRMASSSYAFIGWQATLNADGTPPESDAPPPGWGGGGYTPQNSSL